VTANGEGRVIAAEADGERVCNLDTVETVVGQFNQNLLLQ
jgi:hypothetical protein